MKMTGSPKRLQHVPRPPEPNPDRRIGGRHHSTWTGERDRDPCQQLQQQGTHFLPLQHGDSGSVAWMSSVEMNGSRPNTHMTTGSQLSAEVIWQLRGPCRGAHMASLGGACDQLGGAGLSFCSTDEGQGQTNCVASLVAQNGMAKETGVTTIHHSPPRHPTLHGHFSAH